jgi:hypothetical protein
MRGQGLTLWGVSMFQGPSRYPRRSLGIGAPVFGCTSSVARDAVAGKSWNESGVSRWKPERGRRTLGLRVESATPSQFWEI